MATETENKIKGAEELAGRLSKIEYESPEYKEAMKTIKELKKLLNLI